MLKLELFKRFGRIVSVFARDIRGAVSVEFVLWVPVFIGILLLIADASFLLLEQTRMWQIAANTSRAVAVGRILPSAGPDFAESQSRFGDSYTVDVSTNGGIVATQISVPLGVVSFTKIFAFSEDSKMTVNVIHRIEPTTGG